MVSLNCTIGTVVYAEDFIRNYQNSNTDKLSLNEGCRVKWFRHVPNTRLNIQKYNFRIEKIGAFSRYPVLLVVLMLYVHKAAVEPCQEEVPLPSARYPQFVVLIIPSQWMSCFPPDIYSFSKLFVSYSQWRCNLVLCVLLRKTAVFSHYVVVFLLPIHRENNPMCSLDCCLTLMPVGRFQSAKELFLLAVLRFMLEIKSSSYAFIYI